MGKCLLSVDWDYFVYAKDSWGSYLENKKSLEDYWYKRYIQAKALGKDIEKAFLLSPERNTFWSKIKKHFKFKKTAKAYVSDSHALSYQIAKESNCQAVYLFDSHADLGYGGLPSLDFELNCSNWLGKLLKEGHVKEAHIFLSPHATREPEYFKEMKRIFNIRYRDLNELNERIEVSAIHICRSGAWTPPWLDSQFDQFIDDLGIPCEIVNCPKRKWDPENISLSDQIYYLIAS